MRSEILKSGPDLRAFLKQYHYLLKIKKNFPPLSGNKPMHLAAEVFNLKCAEELESKLDAQLRLNTNSQRAIPVTKANVKTVDEELESRLKAQQLNTNPLPAISVTEADVKAIDEALELIKESSDDDIFYEKSISNNLQIADLLRAFKITRVVLRRYLDEQNESGKNCIEHLSMRVSGHEPLIKAYVIATLAAKEYLTRASTHIAEVPAMEFYNDEIAQKLLSLNPDNDFGSHDIFWTNLCVFAHFNNPILNKQHEHNLIHYPANHFFPMVYKAYLLAKLYYDKREFYTSEARRAKRDQVLKLLDTATIQFPEEANDFFKILKSRHSMGQFHKKKLIMHIGSQFEYIGVFLTDIGSNWKVNSLENLFTNVFKKPKDTSHRQTGPLS